MNEFSKGEGVDGVVGYEVVIEDRVIGVDGVARGARERLVEICLLEIGNGETGEARERVV